MFNPVKKYMDKLQKPIAIKYKKKYNRKLKHIARAKENRIKDYEY